MASKFLMSAPVCLIENKGNQLYVCQEALRLLSEIRQPVVVVAIVGLYRTGKSYLMNKLAGKNSGFALGSTVQANTKGIWMWCVPYPERPNQTLVLLDTEGLGDVEKGDSQNDSWIFALAVLLSSTLVYNSMGTIDQMAMNQLHYVTELTECIKSKSSTRNDSNRLEDSADFVRFFPTFIWALRDFTLQLEINGHPITEDDYLENSLKLKKGDPRETELFNLPRKCIRTFFPTRKCFVFERPTKGKNLHKLEQMQESELDSDFVEQAALFCRYVYWTSKEKTIPGGHVVTGHLLAKLVETYVETIRSGQVPCMENAVLALAEIENTAAVNDAVARYEELMKQKAKLPTATVEELLRIHAECEKEALQVFMARAFKDESRQFQVQLMKTLDQKKEEYCHKNEQESTTLCWAVLTSLSQELENNIKKGIYSQPGGHQVFVDDLKKLEQRYQQEPKKGVKAESVLQQFLCDKEHVGRAILQSDQALTSKEKEMAEAEAKAEAAERERDLQKQQQAVLEQKMEDQQRSYELNLRQLEEKMVIERNKLLAEQQQMMESKLREQDAFLKEGFKKEADRLNGEVQKLKQQNETIRKPGFIGSALGFLADGVSAVLPGALGKAANAVGNFLRKIF
ncbi:guanylate-binding protein 1-like [Elgaria multicarinata webbii]|uniref:guanylate-binding protein 1-like n=1 Tax=Elgaria multicarinata webbii TaxID=159646 RepID=UPI002FCD4498